MKLTRLNKRWSFLFLLAIILSMIYLYPLPYFISKPGDAIELAPIVKVEGGYEESGTFMLTTIRMSGANLLNYAWAHINEYTEIIPKHVLLAQEESEEEYTQRQLRVMQNSQETAIIVAYQLAGREVQYENEGVVVERISPDMPAENVLKVGDVIIQVDELKVKTAEELITYVQSQEIGQNIQLTLLRQDEKIAKEIQLAALPSTEEEENLPPKPGLGISITTKRTVSVQPPVEISTERIGGPSAGLMFSLEIYNQLTKEDITKGYRIAGTGTIDLDGHVGRIGGIHQKVVAADKARSDLFFAPYDGSNYEAALKAAEDIGTSMEIIPVYTIHDALDYLKGLPRK